MRTSGQSTIEYGTIVALVAVAAIFGLSVMGNNIKDILDMMNQTFGGTPAVVASGGGTPGTGGSTPASPFANLPGKNIAIDLGDGKNLQLFMANPETVAETVGGSGVTENSLAVLDQAIQQLKDQGEDPATIAELVALSEKGHKIKEIQELIESKFPPQTFKDADARRYAFSTTEVVLPDQTKTNLYELSKKLSDVYYPDDNYWSDRGQALSLATNFYFFDKGWNEGNMLTDFMNQLKRVENLDIMKEGPLKTLVKDDLSLQIFNSSRQTLYAPDRQELKQYAVTTKMSSNGICKAASGVTCLDKS